LPRVNDVRRFGPPQLRNQAKTVVLGTTARAESVGNLRRSREARRDFSRWPVGQPVVNPMRLCVPSQNGLLAEWPQRHSHTFSVTKRVPSAAWNSIVPSTISGPLWIGLIFTGPLGWAVADAGAFGQAPSSAKPLRVWLPSQNGLLADAPQRHSATRVYSTRVAWSPPGTVMRPRR